MENPMVMDGLWHDWLSEGDQPDAWETDNPQWWDVEELLSNDKRASLVRDFIEIHDELLWELFCNDYFSEFVDPAKQLKDPDEILDEIDRILNEQWDNDSLMIALWDYEPIAEGVCEEIRKTANNDPYDSIRERYNALH